MNTIKDWDDIPHFADEDEEAAFWREHGLDGRLMAGSTLKSDNRDSVAVTLRFDPRMLARIKRLARSRFLNYQSMVKQWLSERMEKEV